MPLKLSEEAAPGFQTAFAYETTEEARLLLADVATVGLEDARHAAAEAARYLADAIEPDEREALLTLAEIRHELASVSADCGEPVTHALNLLTQAANDLEGVLRGPQAEPALRLALQALRRGTAMLRAI